jgi:hypothetical protein
MLRTPATQKGVAGAIEEPLTGESDNEATPSPSATSLSGQNGEPDKPSESARPKRD